jgi:hypothetical protein
VPSINAAATTSSWGGVYGAGKPADGATAGSNLIKKSTFDDGLPGSWGYAGIENLINAGMPYAKNIYFHARDNLENGAGFSVTPGEVLYAAAWFETLGISTYTGSLGVRVLDRTGAVLEYVTLCTIQPNTAWSYVTGSGVVPDDGAIAEPWIQQDGMDFPIGSQYLRASGLFIGRHQLGATVGAPIGTYVGGTQAQDVESQGGAQGKADIARAGAIGAASEDASSKANWARNAAVNDVTPSIDAKLSKAGDTISGRISFAVADGMFAGSDTNNGVYFGKDGLVGRKGGKNTFYINSAGDAEFSGDVKSGRFMTGGYSGWAWPAAGQVGSYLGPEGLLLGNYSSGKYFEVDQNGNVYAPGMKIENGALTINQADVINTLNIGPDQVTIPMSAYSPAETTEDLLQELTISSSGAPVYITFTCFARIDRGGQFSGANESIKLHRNGVEVYSVVVAKVFQGNGDIIPIITISYAETPGAGNVTYSVKGIQDAINGAGVVAYYKNRSLFVLETKR